MLSEGQGLWVVVLNEVCVFSRIQLRQFCLMSEWSETPMFSDTNILHYV